MTISEGDTLPDLELQSTDGGTIRLSEYAGKPFILYFYPKDDTSGCTREAQDFSAMLEAFQGAGAQILGVSKDSPEKHRKFIDKYDLTVPLASDPDGTVLEAFGAWVEKNMYGRKYMGIDRSTFLFDADGKLAQIWRKVRVPGHAEKVLEAVKALEPA
ncbi:peroxiredoxin [Stakelama pacifica]|uniref:thioredoxin-dependent peroxiredoxin n=1 Tax=Stakelama pacifica TaxID=517720 RepID=A0A4R6FS26_9SPHN|nr:peroxiredoxin Q/BCP [Stakelama pacifica]GGO93374.1 peroxiredoxin [Stakelama pacifica]